MRSPLQRSVAALAIALASLVSTAAPASAASGVVSGVLLFFQNQGNYCPNTRNCTGAKYLQSEYKTNQPLRDARIYVTRQSDGEILGEGVTDAAGFFVVAWFDPSVPPFTPVAASLDYMGEHADGRYTFATKEVTFDDPPLRSPLPVDPLRHSFTAQQGFQWLDFPVYGTALVWNDLAQMHDGAHKMWTNSLSQSFRMLLLFNDLQIQFYSFPFCADSCAVGDTNVVVIGNTESAISPQARIMHEMGHIASYLSNTSWDLYNSTRTTHANAYDRNGDSGWTFASSEWEGASWEESIATHYGDVGLYYPWAAAPFSCLNMGACPNAQDAFNIALEPTGSCAVAEAARMAGNHTRYHWDLYDSSADFGGEVWSLPIYESIDTVGTYTSISGEGGIDETWNLARTTLDDRDGRSTRDFANYLLQRGVASNLNLATNCGSAGD